MASIVRPAGYNVTLYLHLESLNTWIQTQSNVFIKSIQRFSILSSVLMEHQPLICGELTLALHCLRFRH